MKQITLNIPDSKYKFFLELVENLGLEKAETADIPEEHKLIVMDRIARSRSNELIDWKKGRNKLRFKSNE